MGTFLRVSIATRTKSKKCVKLVLFLTIGLAVFYIFGGSELFEAYTYSWVIRFEDESVKEDFDLFGYNACSARRKLHGKSNVTVQVSTVESTALLHPDVENGGRFLPKCAHTQTVAIIVPYRDRYENLVIFVYNMHNILKRQLIEYQIFIMEQNDTEPFNRATLFNIGFIEALKLRNFTCFIFHDVDLIPDDDQNIYKCGSMPRHMAPFMSNFNYKLPYHQFLGGVVAVTREQYQQMNGCSNRFWGWGGEDDDMYNRIRNEGWIVRRYSKEVARYTMLTHKLQTRFAARWASREDINVLSSSLSSLQMKSHGKGQQQQQQKSNDLHEEDGETAYTIELTSVGEAEGPGNEDCNNCEDGFDYGDGDGNDQQMGRAGVRTHFYPEGGWGWIVCACAFLAHVTTSGAQLSAGALHIVVANKFQDNHNAHWLGPFSWSVSSMCSPLVVNLCRRKNVRVVSLVGGCLFPLSLLFTSFATELHQFFFCFGLMGGIGSCLVRESSTIVLGEYFRRRRQFAEQVVLAGTGVGVTLFSLLYLSLSRHIEWSQGFQIGAGLSLISAILPAFYRAAAYYHPQRNIIQQLKQQKAQRPTCSSFLVPFGADICKSLKLFCIPSLKPILWSAGISSFGIYAPAFLMSDFGKSEGLTGGSLLLLQTHLGLGLSLGVILGAILTLKKFRCCHISPRMLCCSTGILTGLSMIAISSVKGYYGYSLSAWVYGIALGSYIYTLKILCMDLTRTKHWERIWSCVQSLMGPGCLIGSGLTSYLGKSSFYACATCVLLGSGIIGMELIDLSKCGSPQLSSEDNESPIPPAPAPPLILQNKYGQPINSTNIGATSASATAVGGASSAGTSSFGVGGGFYPLRRSMSLQQPIYPYYSEHFSEFNQPYLPSTCLSYSPHCPDCNPSLNSRASSGHPFYPPQMVRSFSQPQFRNTSTQTQQNAVTPVHGRQAQYYHPHTRVRLGEQPAQSSSSFDQIPLHIHHARPPASHHVHLQQQQPQSQATKQQGRTSTAGSSILGKTSQKYSVMFASNPQLFPEHVHIPQIHNQQQQQQSTDKLDSSRIKSTTSSARSSTERFPDLPIEPQFGHFVPHQNQEPAFTRHYFDSSQMLPPHKRKEKEMQEQKILQRQKQQQGRGFNPNVNPAGSSSYEYQVHQNSHQTAASSSRHQQQDPILNPNKLVQQPQPHYGNITHQRSSSSGSNHVLINPQQSHQQLPSSQGVPAQVLYYNLQQQSISNDFHRDRDRSGHLSHHMRRNSFNTHQRLPPNSSSSTSHQQQPSASSQSSHSHHKSKQKISSYEFDIEEPKFHSLRKPSHQQQQRVSTISTQNHSASPGTVAGDDYLGYEMYQQGYYQQQQNQPANNGGGGRQSRQGRLFDT